MRRARQLHAVDKITLDRDTFKALASDTRLDILKALDERQKTVTELARELDLDKSTVFEHLEKLATPNVGLIQKLEDERKWVYWQLTWKGRRLLHPEAITLALVLSSAGASLVTAVVAAWLWLRSNIAPPVVGSGPGAGAKSLAAPVNAQPPTAPPVQHDPVLMAAWIALAVVFVAFLVVAAVVLRRARVKKAAQAA